MWYDAWLMPAGAPHPEAAYRFLNYMLEPKVIADTTNEIHYGNDNLAANAYVAPDILSNPAIYPTAAMAKRLYPSREVSAATERVAHPQLDPYQDRRMKHPFRSINSI